MKTAIIRLLAGTAALAVLAPAALAQAPAKPADRWTIIHAGTLLADAGKPSKTNQTIVVKNDKIEAIRDGFVGPEVAAGADPASVKVIELKDKFVMPGMLDAHVHIAGRGGFAGALRASREKLLGGATTVRDAGSDPVLIFPLRDAINQGMAVGPRILASGDAIGATGGHGDSRNGNFNASLEPLHYYTGVCDGVGDCTKATRRQIQLGADQIKLVATAGVGDNSDTGLEQQMTDEELKAVVESAHLMKRKVMAHAIGAEGVKAAVRAGVDSIEHANDLDDAGAKLMKERGTWMVATLMAPTDVLRRVRDPKTSASISENTKKKVLGLPEAQPGGIGRQVKVAVRNGVKIAVGTDFGGTIGDEMVLMVEAGGMTPDAVLKAATLGNAELFGMSDQIGTLAPGKSADIVGLDGDPRKNIRVTTNPVFVMSQGHQAKGEGFSLP